MTLRTPRSAMRTPSTLTRPQPPSSVPIDTMPRLSTDEVSVAPSSTPQKTTLAGAPKAAATSIVRARMPASAM